MAQRVVVMYAGRKVEEAPVDELFAAPLHPYTRGPARSMPRLGVGARGRAAPPRLAEIPGHGAVAARRRRRLRLRAALRLCDRALPPRGCPPLEAKTAAALGRLLRTEREARRAGRMSARRLRRCSRSTACTSISRSAAGCCGRVGGQVHAVDGISFTIGRARPWAWSARVGCGKSTAGKAILKLIEPTAGEIRLRGHASINGLSPSAMRPYRRELQVVFQDPYSSLNPRISAGAHRRRAARELRHRGRAASVEDRVASLLRSRRSAAESQMRRYPARILRRPAPAHRHRARAGAQSEPDRLRRAGLGARCLGAGAGRSIC